MSSCVWFLLGMASSDAAQQSTEFSNLPLKEQLIVELLAIGILFVVLLILAVIKCAIEYWMERW